MGFGELNRKPGLVLDLDGLLGIPLLWYLGWKFFMAVK